MQESKLKGSWCDQQLGMSGHRAIGREAGLLLHWVPYLAELVEFVAEVIIFGVDGEGET